MSSTHYKQYYDNVMALAKSLVIKSEACAEQINETMRNLGFEVTDDPRTWKYYQNVAGEYHFLDEPIEIISLDTLMTIEFTKENMQRHLDTVREYRKGGQYYKELVERYPNKELLIKGILFPVDLDAAVEAKDYTILAYDDSYVESNETNLITLLQERIYQHGIRWDVPIFGFTDELYIPAHLGILYLNIPMWIMNIRLANCKTRFAHSFHIREYLKSHNKLDGYFDYLTKKQMLFLYRNILYIERNAGKQETFGWLEENLLSERGIGLAEYHIEHNLEGMPGQMRPDITLERRGVNKFHPEHRNDSHTMLEVMDKQVPVAPSNRRVLEETYQRDRERLKNSRRNRLATKTLESTMIDRSDSGFVTMADFLLNHWAYWSVTGRYVTNLSVPDPRTGESISLTAKDAFTLFLFAYNRSVGQDLDRVPDITVNMVRKDQLPTREELRNITQQRHVPDELLEEILADQPKLGQYVSEESFIESVQRIYQRTVAMRDVYARQQHHMARAQVQSACDHLYMNTRVSTEPDNPLYETWLAEKSLPLWEYTDLELGILADRLMEAAMGLGLKSNRSLEMLQNAMLRLMGQLSSYSIQFISEINRGPILVWDWSVVRVGDIDGYGRAYDTVSASRVKVLDINGRGVSDVGFDVSKFSRVKYHIKAADRLALPLKLTLKPHGRHALRQRIRLPQSRISIYSSSSGTLTDEQRLTLTDLYGGGYPS